MNVCELCSVDGALQSIPLAPKTAQDVDYLLRLCSVCALNLDQPLEVEPIHWRGLAEAIWSERPVVQAASYRILHTLRDLGWTSDILDMVYLDEVVKDWAEAGSGAKHLDCFGALLVHGDNVVLTQSLDVKGSSLTAKKGTVVRNIRLVRDNPEQMEGRVEGQLIVILTKYVKKQG